MGVATFTAAGDPVPLGGSNVLYPGTITMSSSYATGGDTLDMTGDLNPRDGRLLIGGGPGYVLEWDGANAKVKAYRDNGTATAAALPEVAAAVNLSTVSVEAWALLVT